MERGCPIPACSPLHGHARAGKLCLHHLKDAGQLRPRQTYPGQRHPRRLGGPSLGAPEDVVHLQAHVRLCWLPGLVAAIELVTLHALHENTEHYHRPGSCLSPEQQLT